ncbi:hypothetical protein AAFC00_002769 [Neodothiora populina]|uniref:Major facilitator superfamily (MFS) profile domain-containing protein n=1 Tax=Neodothiora populina TaxID=2781224 RepID=A0ABR3P865_9PEZI
MPFWNKRTEHDAQNATTVERAPAPVRKSAPFIAWLLGFVASIGGFMFGYQSGQISGYFQMSDYCARFGVTAADGTCSFPPLRQGTITANLCAGALVGAIIAGKMADLIGRRMSVSVSAFFCMIGTIIEISSSQHWAQYAVGRGIGGIGIGALSVCVPMYQSESAPMAIRGVLVASYQLFITLGIWTGAMVDYGTHDAYTNSAQWRIPSGLSFIWAVILGCGMLFLPESPRYAYRKGREDEARAVIARLAGISPDDDEVNHQINDIRVKLEEESAAVDTSIFEIFTGPRMFYRTMLGITLQAGQQLTGANFFFYYGTTVFAATGLKDSYVTQIILDSVNVFCTFGGLWVSAKVGRRKALMYGAAWSFMCFMIYSFVGHFIDPKTSNTSGNVLIVFSCFFIVAFATTWGPLVWTIVAELYPAKYRAPCMALATASNWGWNFLISLFTQLIVGDIDYLYGLVFGGCCFALFWIVYFFVIESKDRSLEEIDTMYILHVNPITSSKWDGSKVPEDAMATGMFHGGESKPVSRVPSKEQV